ncbi:uncharacterized protein RB166_018856 [Leptodactylus fuscus]|uniref:uncharacterized protein LOC142183076 n=1 Tax=Leptodactylus fuscus TaxID=238119 RepID=UPI003F4EFBA4
MNSGTANTENGNVSCETPGGTTVHLNTGQKIKRSCIACCSSHLGAAHLGFGIAYISLGFFSLTLAIVIDLVQLDLFIFFSKFLYCVGFPFLVSGALSLVAYKSPEKCWTVSAFTSILLSFSVSLVGIFIAADDLQTPYRFFDEKFCDNVRNGGNGDYYRTTTPPRYYYGSDEGLRACKEAMEKYKDVVVGLIYMTLLVMVWGLLLSVFSMGPRLKSCCCRKKPEMDEEELIVPNPDDITLA